MDQAISALPFLPPTSFSIARKERKVPWSSQPSTLVSQELWSPNPWPWPSTSLWPVIIWATHHCLTSAPPHAHPQVPSVEKNCLLWTQSLLPKTLGTTVLGGLVLHEGEGRVDWHYFVWFALLSPRSFWDNCQICWRDVPPRSQKIGDLVAWESGGLGATHPGTQPAKQGTSF